jgi:haloacetate dehalogenase
MTQNVMPELSAPKELMEGFGSQQIQTSWAVINVAIAGEGMPLPLLHENPLTHVSWHGFAPALAKSFTVIAPDLRGAEIPTGHYPVEHRPYFV